MKGSCSVGKISDLVSKLSLSSQLSFVQQGDVTLTAALQEERVWQDTAERFIQRLKAELQCFMDIVVPFNVGVLGVSCLIFLVSVLCSVLVIKFLHIFI